jgi:hypothetical protein
MRRLLNLFLLLLPGMLVIACGGSDTATEPAQAPAEAAVQSDTTLSTGLSAIAAEGIEKHLRFLADDARQGRMTGSPEYDEAAAYVAEQFAAMGLEPGGEDGGWFQAVPLLSRTLDENSATLVFHQDGEANAQRFKEDFVMGGDYVRPKTEVTAEVVFAGFGVHAPELGYSDYDDIDVEGKIVALFGGAPATFPHNERAYYSSSLAKSEEAVRRGAIGLISLRSRVDQQRYDWKRITQFATGQPGMTWINLSGRAANYFPELRGGAIVNVPSAEDLFSRSPISFEDALDAADAGTPLSTPLGVEATLARETQHESISSPNVIGILRGSDPELADEYVVFTAHLDHVGVGEAVNDDTIYNGMYDNAMGSSILIETARAFVSMPEAPKRSIIFIAVTGEERGLIGSDYYAHYPTVPSDSMVANVNLDMPLFLYPLADMIAFGAEHSSLGPVVEEAIAEEGFALLPDPMPQETIFIRSDQYSFVRQGVPAVFLVSGYTSSDPAIDGQALWQGFLQKHYHQPDDDLNQPVDWPSAERFTRANVRIGYSIAQEPARPTWNEGDFFGEKFAR